MESDFFLILELVDLTLRESSWLLPEIWEFGTRWVRYSEVDSYFNVYENDCVHCDWKVTTTHSVYDKLFRIWSRSGFRNNFRSTHLQYPNHLLCVHWPTQRMLKLHEPIIQTFFDIKSEKNPFTIITATIKKWRLVTSKREN